MLYLERRICLGAMFFQGNHLCLRRLYYASIVKCCLGRWIHTVRSISASEYYVVSRETNLCLGRLCCVSGGELVSWKTMLEFYIYFQLCFNFNDPIPIDRRHMLLWYVAIDEINFGCQKCSLAIFITNFSNWVWKLQKNPLERFYSYFYFYFYWVCPHGITAHVPSYAPRHIYAFSSH